MLPVCVISDRWRGTEVSVVIHGNYTTHGQYIMKYLKQVRHYHLNYSFCKASHNVASCCVIASRIFSHSFILACCADGNHHALR